MNVQQMQSAARMKARAIRAEHDGRGFLTLSELATELGYKDRRTAKKWLAANNVMSMPNGRHVLFDVDSLAAAITRAELSGNK